VGKKATIELFNEQVEVTAFPKLSGKKCTVGIRHQYSDYKEKDEAFVSGFLTDKGLNSKGEDLLDTMKEQIEKNPFKKSKAKKAAAPAPSTGGSEDGAKQVNGWG